MGAKSQPWASSLYVDTAQGCDLASIIVDLSQSEKLSEIKPPLKIINATESAILCTNANAFYVWKVFAEMVFTILELV